MLHKRDSTNDEEKYLILNCLKLFEENKRTGYEVIREIFFLKWKRETSEMWYGHIVLN